MKNQSSSKRNVDPGAEVSHLETTLTEITTTTSKKLKLLWKPLVAVLAALFIAVLLWQIYQQVRETKDVALNERIYRLLESPAAKKDDYKLDSTQLADLLAEAHGRRVEPVVYRTAVEFYLDQAERLARKAKEDEKKVEDPLNPASSPAGVAPPAQPAGPQVEEAYNQALKLAEDAKSKLAGNAEIEAWAQQVKDRIEGERKRDWLPGKWKFTLPVPKPVDTPSSPAAAPGAEARPAEAAPGVTQPQPK